MYIIAAMIGVTTGIISGLIGIGGGVLLIPALVYLMNFGQHVSQGTTLAAMVPPIGILAAYQYYKSGFVNIPVALIISIGFLLGGFLGAKFALNIDGYILRKLYGLLLFILSIGIFFGK